MIEEAAMPSGVYIEGRTFWERLGAASLKSHHPVGGIASGGVGASVGFSLLLAYVMYAVAALVHRVLTFNLIVLKSVTYCSK